MRMQLGAVTILPPCVAGKNEPVFSIANPTGGLSRANEDWLFVKPID